MSQQQPIHQTFHNNTRRTFRGTSGANDSQNLLDKSKLQLKRKSKKYVSTSTSSDKCTKINDNDNLNIVNPTDDDDNGSCNNIINDNDSNSQNQLSDNNNNMNDNYNHLNNDIIHLKKRIENTYKTIKNSNNNTLTQLLIYQSNVLFPIQNCIKEWHSIINYHIDIIVINIMNNTDVHDTRNPNDIIIINQIKNNIKLISLQLFNLIQLSIQCGPLIGSKPAYYKRCGNDIINIIIQHLNYILNYFNITTTTNNNGKLKHNGNNNEINNIENMRNNSENECKNENKNDHDHETNDDNDGNNNDIENDIVHDFNNVNYRNPLNDYENDSNNHCDQVNDKNNDNDYENDSEHETDIDHESDSDNDSNSNDYDSNSDYNSDDDHGRRLNIRNEKINNNQQCNDNTLYFTMKQVNTIILWKINAEKTLLKNQLNNKNIQPSKFIQKCQVNGIKHSINKKDIKNKKLNNRLIKEQKKK